MAFYHSSLDEMALLFLFTVIVVLCLVSSCMEDGEGESAEERARRPPRARERSPVWRSQLPDKTRREGAD